MSRIILILTILLSPSLVIAQTAEEYVNDCLKKSNYGDYEDAIEDCNKAIELNPEIAEAYNNRAIAKMNLDELQSALQDINKAIELDPDNLSDRITELARDMGNAEVTLSQVVSELRVPDEAAVAALSLLEQRGQCHRERRDVREVFVFPGLRLSLIRRRCPYCGSEFSVKTPAYTCPNCGGDLQLERH